jgi:hypothetical protein
MSKSMLEKFSSLNYINKYLKLFILIRVGIKRKKIIIKNWKIKSTREGKKKKKNKIIERTKTKKTKNPQMRRKNKSLR